MKTLPVMTDAEKQEFSRLSVAVRNAVTASAVVDKGASALLRIREGQLYRDEHKSYDDYLLKTGLTRRRADQIVAIFKLQTGVQNNLGNVLPESFDTLSERALHPLMGLSSEAASAAVLEAAASPGGISPTSIKAAAKKRKKPTRKPVFKSRRFLVPGAVVVITFNRKSNGSLLDVTGYLQSAVEKELAEQQQEETKAA
jgi:hypothetical protein